MKYVAQYLVPKPLHAARRTRWDVKIDGKPMDFPSRTRALLADLVLENLLGSCPDLAAARALLDIDGECAKDVDVNRALVAFKALLAGELR